ncbi:S-adenosyl-L-methionine-dependent methyltransferase [Xylariales sp. AK1849]|nr:S-adenosyl-L-methionine-dependent methyltransferase [Xylariales sp. AK1849]
MSQNNFKTEKHDDEEQPSSDDKESQIRTRLHFEQFPPHVFVPEYSFNPELQSEAPSRQFQPPLPFPSQLLSNHSAISSRPSAAQWSAHGFNAFVPSFLDQEVLNHEITGGSIAEEGAVLGESGRTYHAYKQDTSGYLLPNDAAEQDRLDLQHYLCTILVDGRLTLAPLPRAPKLVLDVATGTGIWALEFARANPSSFVIGTDLSKIQPLPDVPNCLFERMDCEDDWLWSYKYDYIHIRHIVSAIHDPVRLIQQAFKFLNPGGWLELQDADFDLLSEEGPDKDDRVPSSNLRRWFELGAVGGSQNGIDFHKAKKYKDWLDQTGFSNVREEKFQVACNPWPKDSKAQRVGLWMQANYMSGLRGVGYKMLRSAGMPPDEIETFIKATREEVMHGGIRGYTPWYSVYGKKPFEKEECETKGLSE